MTTPSPLAATPTGPAWGIAPNEAAIVAWGARGIVDRVETKRKGTGRRSPETIVTYSVGLLHDRTDVVVTQPAPTPELARNLSRALVILVDEHIRPAANELVDSNGGAEYDRTDLLLPDTNPGEGLRSRIRIAGGYAYLGAWIQADQPGWDAPDVKWSGASTGFERPPELGTIVRCRLGDECIVLRRCVVSGYCGVVLLPLDPPAWFRTNSSGKLGMATMFGAELRKL